MPFKHSTATVDGLSFNCSDYTFNSSYADIMAAYDNYFGPRRPQTDADFGWQVDESVLSIDILSTVKFDGAPTNIDVSEMEELFDFDPGKYNRETGRNIDIFRNRDSGDKKWPFMHYNPLDFIPTTATHYTRTDTKDIIANQFYFKKACNADRMIPLLDSCPDCAGSIVPLSCNDVYKIFDVRFVRLNGNDLELSKVFRMVSVDCAGSGAYTYYTEGAVYRFVDHPTAGFIKTDRRVEVGGWYTLKLGTYMSPTPIMVRLSSGADFTPAPVDDDGGTDQNATTDDGGNSDAPCGCDVESGCTGDCAATFAGTWGSDWRQRWIEECMDIRCPGGPPLSNPVIETNDGGNGDVGQPNPDDRTAENHQSVEDLLGEEVEGTLDDDLNTGLPSPGGAGVPAQETTSNVEQSRADNGNANPYPNNPAYQRPPATDQAGYRTTGGGGCGFVDYPRPNHPLLIMVGAFLAIYLRRRRVGKACSSES